MIDKYAFYNCDSLESVSIPKNVYDIADFAFANCNNLSAIIVDKDNANYDSRDNCNAIIESSSNSLLFGCKTTIVPQGVKSIGDGAFQGCSGLTSLSLPSSVKTIGNNAFEYFKPEVEPVSKSLIVLEICSFVNAKLEFV